MSRSTAFTDLVAMATAIIRRNFKSDPQLVPTVERTFIELAEELAHAGLAEVHMPRFIRFAVEHAIDRFIEELGDRLPKALPPAPAAREGTYASGDLIAPPHDPRVDDRPEAYHLYDRSFVTLTDEDRRRVRGSVTSVPASEVAAAWRRCEWHRLAEVNTVGERVRVASLEAVRSVLPKMGTNRLRYSMAEGFVCRDYAATFAGLYVAQTTAACAIIMDFSGEHSYNAMPVMDGVVLRWIVVEPQADAIVAHLDPAEHYVGSSGFAVLL